MSKARIAVLVSGGGTNLQALIDAQTSGIISSGTIELVISNNSGAYALERAANAGIATEVVLKKVCGSQEAFEEKIKALLTQYKIDLIVLAGFMSILSESFTRDYPERIINVHPSLIPSFCGKGYYGLRVHEEALAYGVKVPVQPFILSTRSPTVARSLPKRLLRSWTVIPRKCSKSALWNRQSGKFFPLPWKQ